MQNLCLLICYNVLGKDEFCAFNFPAKAFLRNFITVFVWIPSGNNQNLLHIDQMHMSTAKAHLYILNIYSLISFFLAIDVLIKKLV